MFPSHTPQEKSLLDTVPLVVMSLTVIPLPPAPKTPATQKREKGGIGKSGGGGGNDAAGSLRIETASAESDPVCVIASSLATNLHVDNGPGPARPASKSIMFVVGSNPIAAEGEIGGKGQDDVRFFHTEKEALEKWLEWALEVDADCWTTFEAQVALCALISRGCYPAIFSDIWSG